MRLPSEVGSQDTYLDGPSDGLRVDVSDGEGTVTVLHRWTPGSRRSSAPGTTRSRALLRWARVAGDAVAAVAALAVVDVLPSGDPGDVIGLLAVAAIFPLTMAMLGAYRRGAPSTLRTSTTAVALTAFAGAALGAASDPKTLDGTRLLALAGWLALFHAGASAAWSGLSRTRRMSSMRRVPTAVLGTPEHSVDVTDALGAAGSDLSPVAIIDHRDGNGATAQPLTATVDRVLRESGAECLLVVDGGLSSTDLDALRRVARLRDAEMRLLVRTPDTLPGALHVRALEGHALVEMPKVTFGGAPAIAKRTLDLALGSFGFIVAMPLMVGIALAIKVTSRGPVLFRQERVTKGGRPFRILKFRTMEHQGRVDDDVTRPFFKLHDDPRLTRIGRVLRSQSLDELPQLWNVLKGEMSLVGPRPLPREQVLAHPELLGSRHEVAPGMTGWWQVNGRSDLPAEEAVAYDRFYIENWSIWLDVRIILKTVAVLLTRRGAY